MKKILLLFIFLSSFNANALVVATTSTFKGKIFKSNVHIAQSISGKCLPERGRYHLSISVTQYPGRVSSLGHEYTDSACTKIFNGNQFLNVSYSSTSCPSGTEYNENTLSCEELSSFCDSPEIEEKRQAEMELCSNVGGQYFETCTNDPQEWLPECRNVPEPECVEGSPIWPECADVPKCNANNPNWPACLWPPEPDIDDNPDFDSSNPPSINDPSPEIDKQPDIPPVEVLPPDEGNANILKAIANLNKDNNQLITRLNKDLNVGLSDNTDHIKKLNDNTIGFWEDSVHGFNNINRSINNQNDVIRQSSTATNNFLSTLIGVTKEGSDSIVEAIQTASEKDKIIDIADVPADDLYTRDDLTALNNDVSLLKEDYQRELNKFKSYFNFQTEVNSGDYNSHTLKQNWGGKELTFDNFALTVFVDNADIIGLIIIFGFGIAGIRIILEAV